MKDRRVRYSDEQLKEMVRIATERLGLDAVIDAADAVPDDPFGHDYCIIPTISNLAIGEHKSEGAAMKAAVHHAEHFHTNVRVARILSTVSAAESLAESYESAVPSQKKFAKSYAGIVLCLMLLSIILTSIIATVREEGPKRIEHVRMADLSYCTIIDRQFVECENYKERK